MTIEKILNEMIKIHERFSFESYSNKSSQMCSLWSTDDPPDILEGTEQLDEICKIINKNIGGNYAVELYDMTLIEAATALYNFHKNK